MYSVADDWPSSTFQILFSCCRECVSTDRQAERERDFMGLCCDLTLVAAAAAAAADLGLSGCRAVQPGDLLKQYLM